MVGAAIVTICALFWAKVIVAGRQDSLVLLVGGFTLVAALLGHRLLSHWHAFDEGNPTGFWTRVSAFLGWRHWGRYPPVWLSAVLGFGLVLVVLPLRPKFFGLDGSYEIYFRIIASVSLGLCLVLTVFWVAFFRSAKRPAFSDLESAPGAVPIYENLDAFRTWILGDDAIRKPSDDIFGHSMIAARIAARLDDSGTSDQTVIGPLGSGKTGILHLTQWFLQQAGASHVEVVKVDLWPYETPKAAVEGVIRHLIRAIGRHAETYAVQTLPKEYSQLAGAAANFGALLTGTIDESSPTELLTRIERILEAIDLRLVVWLEDLERFAPTVRRDSTEEEDSERLNPLRALIHRFSQSRSIVVVTATTSAHSRFDLEKISRYLEEVPAIDDHKARRLLLAFFELCQREDYIEAASVKVLRNWETELRGGFGDRMSVSGSRFASFPQAALAMCENPRALKVAFRSTLETWKVLAGEIDLRDLLLLNLFRELSPRAFAELRDNRDDFSVLSRGFDRFDESKEAFFARLKEMNLSSTAWDVTVLFVERLLAQDSSRPQGVWDDRYWQRYISRPLSIDADDSDQTVLRAIRDNDDDALLEVLATPLGDKIYRFARHIGEDRAVSLLVPLVRQRLLEEPGEWPDDGFSRWPPGIIALWYLWGQLKPSADLMVEPLRTAAEIAVENLVLAQALEYFFLSTRERTSLSAVEGFSKVTGAVREDFWRALVRRYEEAPADLAIALQPSRAWTLARLVWGSNRFEEKSFDGLPFDRWEALSIAILQAVEFDRTTMLSQIAFLITIESGSTLSGSRSETVYRFDEHLCRRLFGDVDAILGLYENDFQPLEGSEDCLKAIRKPIEERKG